METAIEQAEIPCEQAWAMQDRGNCHRCHRSLDNIVAFTLGGEFRCWRCALLYTPMLARSAKTALIVGTLVTAINQGTFIFAGQLSPALLWKIPMTYCVPFCVATWGALSNNRL